MTATTFKDNIGKEDLRQFGGNNRTFQRRNSAGALLTLHSVGNVVDVLQSYGDGTTPAQANLSSAIVGANGNEVTFELAPGTWPITSALTIPSTVTVHLLRGAAFSVSVGITLTINGPVFADGTAWYSGAGTVTVVSGVSQVTGAAIKAGTTLEAGTTLAVGTNATVGGTLGVTGAATVGGTLGVTGAVTAADLSASGTLGGKLAHRGAQVYHSVTQNISSSAITKLNFDSEAYDTSTIHDPVTANTRLTVPAGVTRVRLQAQIGYSGNATGLRYLFLYKNLADVGPGRIYLAQSAASSGGSFLNASTATLTVVAGDYFEMCAYQDSGSTLTTIDAGVNAATWFAMEIIE